MILAERVIVPLDVPDLAAARAQVARLPAVRFWKIGLELFTATGPQLISDLKQQDLKVFLDLKLHDIPNTVAGASRAATRLGVDFLTVHAAGGARMLCAASEACRLEAGRLGITPPRILAITVLTSLDADALRDLHVALELSEYVLQLALLSQRSGVDGVVCSPWETGLLRSACGPDFCIVTPGIRPQGDAQQDQRRTLTPREAWLAGADYLVVGRPITGAGDPAVAFEAVVEEIAAC